MINTAVALWQPPVLYANSKILKLEFKIYIKNISKNKNSEFGIIFSKPIDIVSKMVYNKLTI